MQWQGTAYQTSPTMLFVVSTGGWAVHHLVRDIVMEQRKMGLNDAEVVSIIFARGAGPGEHCFVKFTHPVPDKFLARED